MKNYDDINILSGRIARDLISQKRFVLEDIFPNKRDFKRTVFSFENTLELREYLSKEHNIVVN